MSRDFPVTAVRMPPELKDRLLRECKITGRSMNAEIVYRLQFSLDHRPPYGSISNELEDSAKRGSGTVEISDHERQCLARFKRLSVEKQIALLLLLE